MVAECARMIYSIVIVRQTRQGHTNYNVRVNVLSWLVRWCQKCGAAQRNTLHVCMIVCTTLLRRHRVYVFVHWRITYRVCTAYKPRNETCHTHNTITTTNVYTYASLCQVSLRDRDRMRRWRLYFALLSIALANTINRT